MEWEKHRSRCSGINNVLQVDGGFSGSAETYVYQMTLNKGIYCFRNLYVPVSEYKSSLILSFPQNF